MKRTILFLGVALLTSSLVRAQAPTIVNGFPDGHGIGLSTGSPNFSDASLHIKAAPNPFYSSLNGQQIFFCETSNAPGDNLRIMNAKGSTGNTFIPLLMGTTTTDAAAAGLILTGNTSLANDVATGGPLMIFNTSKGFTPQSSLETPGAAQNIANRTLFQWRNNSALLMTMTPTTTANGDARLSFGTTAVPTYKFELSSPFPNDGVRIINTSTASAAIRLKANTGKEWSIQSSGTGNSVGANNLFIQDVVPGTYRFFIQGSTGNIGMGNTNSLTTVPQLKLDINTPSQNDGIRVTQTGTTSATLSLVGGGTVGTAPGQARRWSLHSTGSGNPPYGAGHLLFWDWTTNVERMRIHENGFVGINTVNTAGQAPTNLLHVKSQTNPNGVNMDPVRFEMLNPARDSSIVTIDPTGVLHTRTIASLGVGGISNSCTTIGQVPLVSTGTGDLACSQITDIGTGVGVGIALPSYNLDVNGSVHCITLSVTSDRRYKKDIAAVQNANDIISKLQGVTYKFKKDEYKAQKFDDKKQIGFIAQDVEKVLPEAVSKDKDGYYAINYIAIIPVLTEAIKSQNSKIDALQNEIAEIKQMLSLQVRTANPAIIANTKTSTKVYPNPVNGSSITIEHFTTNETPVYVTITDMQGRQVSTKQFNPCAHCTNKFSMEVNQLANGTYTVMILNDGKTSVQKIVVAK